MKCDRCGKEVDSRNDASLLLSYITDLRYESRHLLPVVAQCLGSPSLAQYLPGQPRDTRPGGPHYNDQKFGSTIRETYKLLQQESR